MELLWILLVVAVLIGILVIIVKAKGRWKAVKSEGASRADLIHRLQAYLNANGIRSKIETGVANTVQLKVLEKDVEQAREWIEQYQKENV